MKQRWFTTDFSSIGSLPKIPGVYVLYRDNKVVYVGQSVNIRQRLKNHFAGSHSKHISNCTKSKIKIKYRVNFRIGAWAMLEQRLIAKLKPEWNKTVESSWKELLKDSRLSPYYSPLLYKPKPRPKPVGITINRKRHYARRQNH
jgi:predicted GIY-YIG superfamily endonuclease